MLADLTWGEAPVAPLGDGLDATAMVRVSATDEELHLEEAALARTLAGPRRSTFIAGRAAMRRALRLHGYDGSAPILRSARGAPTLPDHVAGSIAHKQTLAVAAVASRTPDRQHVGIDLERRPSEADLLRPSIASRILLAAERERVAALATSPLHQRELELVHFAVKEAVYKAVDPIVQRYVGFLEVELHLALDAPDAGTASTWLHMAEFANTMVPLRTAWRCADEWIIAAAILGEP